MKYAKITLPSGVVIEMDEPTAEDIQKLCPSLPCAPVPTIVPSVFPFPHVPYTPRPPVISPLIWPSGDRVNPGPVTVSGAPQVFLDESSLSRGVSFQTNTTTIVSTN